MAIGFTYISKAKKGTSIAIVFGWYIGDHSDWRCVRGDVVRVHTAHRLNE